MIETKRKVNAKRLLWLFLYEAMNKVLGPVDIAVEGRTKYVAILFVINKKKRI